MIDIHNHIIYHFDDGPKTLEDALKMLQAAADQGITDVFATSHFNEVIHAEAEADYFRKLACLQEEVDKRNLGLRLHSGSEMFFHLGMDQTIRKTRVGTLGEKGLYILMEFPLYLMPSGAEETLFQLTMDGYRPIIAHPERYSSLHQKPHKILNFVRHGGLLQVNAGSVLGQFGRTVQKIAMELLEQHMVHFIGSDAHSPKGRSFLMAAAADSLREHLDEAYIQDLVSNNARKIIENQPLEPMPLPEEEDAGNRGLIDRMRSRLKSIMEHA